MAELLQAAGHAVEPWTPPNLMEIFEVFTNFLMADKGHFFLETMKYETIDEAIRVNAMNYKTPVVIRNLVARLIGLLSYKMRRLWMSGCATAREQWLDNAKKDRLIYELTAAWEERGYDVLLCSAFTMPAVPPRYCSRILPAASYTSVYNLVGCPAGIVPVTQETAADQAHNTHIAWSLTSWIYFFNEHFMEND